MGSQCSRVEAACQGVDGVSGRHARSTKRWAGCTSSDGRAHRFNNLGHVRVAAVIVFELAVVVDVPHTGLIIDEIFDLMCTPHVGRMFALTSRFFLFCVLDIAKKNECVNG
jgi:hypothetical protein